MTTALQVDRSTLRIYTGGNSPAPIVQTLETIEPQSLSLEAVSEPEKKSCSSHVLASQLASAVSTTVFYPFDTLRIRYMSQDGTVQRQHNGRTYRSICRAIGVIWKEEGPRALFRGCHVAVLGTVVAWGVYMFVYRGLCKWLDVSCFYGRTALSAVAGLTSTMLTTPMWLLKTRMQIESGGAGTVGNYATFSTGVRYLLATAGVRSLWRGVSAQLLLVLPNSLSFPIYDFLKESINRAKVQPPSLSNTSKSDNNLSVTEACVCSTMAKAVVTTLSQPFTVLKVRLQDQRWNQGEVKYTNLKETFSLIAKREGVLGFTRGLTSSLLYSIPRGVAYYVLYEKSLQFLSS